MEANENPGRARAQRRYLAQFKARNQRISIIAISACVLLLVASLIIAAVSLLGKNNKDDGRILSNVYVAGVNLGGMDRSEAESALRLVIGDHLTTQDMVVQLPDTQLILSPDNTQASVLIEDLVDAAYQYGRSGTKAENRRTRALAETKKYVIPLLDHMYLDLEYIRHAVDDFCSQYSSVMVQTTVRLNGTRPDYRTIIADGIPISSVKHQTLTIQVGTPQFSLDPEMLYREILDAYSLFQLTFSYEAPVAVEPDLPDAQVLFDTYCVLPADAVMDGNSFHITPEIYGYGFDVAEAARKIHRANYGDTVTITLGFLYPDITEEDLSVNYFQDVLATYISSNSSFDANRNTNLSLACKAIDGTIIKSGESFDFNTILGPRTTNAGYKSAPTFAGSSSQTIGGGIGQVASVLRYCAMLSGLQIDEYHLHTYAVPYTPYGTDAAISYGTENLVFTNTSSDPIQIFASAIDGTVIISIMGTNEQLYTSKIEYNIVEILNPEVEYQYMTEDNVYGYTDGYELQTPIVGYVVDVYLCQYDPLTGLEVSRTLLETCTYHRRNQVIVRLEYTPDATEPGV